MISAWPDSNRKSSSHSVASKSRWFEGSSSIIRSGSASRSLASSSRFCCPPLNCSTGWRNDSGGETESGQHAFDPVVQMIAVALLQLVVEVVESFAQPACSRRPRPRPARRRSARPRGPRPSDRPARPGPRPRPVPAENPDAGPESRPAPTGELHVPASASSRPARISTAWSCPRRSGRPARPLARAQSNGRRPAPVRPVTFVNAVDREQDHNSSSTRGDCNSDPPSVGRAGEGVLETRGGASGCVW